MGSGTTKEASGQAGRVSRRALLKLTGLALPASVGLLSAACGSSSSGGRSTAATSGTSNTGSGAAPAASSTTVASTTSGTNNAGGNLAQNQTLRYPYLEPVTMDPGLANADIEIMMNMWEGLVGFDQQGNPIPLGATHWETSGDGAVYTFHLRDGVNWTDGSPVTAHDYEWTWKRNEDPKTASVYANALYPIKNAEAYNKGQVTADQMGVKALDDTTLQVTLENPTGYFLRICTTWTALPLPKKAIEQYGQKWTEADHVISNGPFTMTSWSHDQSMVLERNDGYWGTKPTLSKVEVTITSDPTKTDLTAFENDELDVAYGPWPADIDRVQKDQTLSKQLRVFANSATAFVVCDTTNAKSPISTLDFRKALYLGIDRQQLVNNVLKKVGVAAYTMLPPDILGYNPAARIPGGIPEAKAALSTAGFAGGKSAPAIQLTFIQNTANNLVVQVLQQMWSENLGLKTTLNAMESNAFFAYRSTLKNKHFEMMLNSWGSDYLDPYDWDNFLFMSNTDYYHSHWSNKQFDDLVSQAAVATDQSKRKSLYQQAEVPLVQNVPNIPLYHTATPYLMKSWIQGYQFRAVGGDPWAPVKIVAH